MIKSIGYAYATSATASRLGVPEDGGYFIATYDSEGQEDDLLGPFATLEQAEERAATVSGDWSRFTMRAGATA